MAVTTVKGSVTCPLDREPSYTAKEHSATWILPPGTASGLETVRAALTQST